MLRNFVPTIRKPFDLLVEGLLVPQHKLKIRVEAAGIEPASRDVSMEASTRVVNCLSVVALTPVDRVRRDQPGALFHADRARHGPALVGFGD